jgi:hypothetical protein
MSILAAGRVVCRIAALIQGWMHADQIAMFQAGMHPALMTLRIGCEWVMQKISGPGATTKITR